MGQLTMSRSKPSRLDHAADYGYLLEVLLAEIGACGAAPREELAHNLRHAVEVARAHGALHDFGHRAEVEPAGVGLGIYLFGSGDECVVDAGRLEECGVGVFGARVGAEVVGVVELRGVDEDAHHNDIVLGTGAVDQRLVPVVQCAHCRHKAY